MERTPKSRLKYEQLLEAAIELLEEDTGLELAGLPAEEIHRVFNEWARGSDKQVVH